jgi:hypothetical protein
MSILNLDDPSARAPKSKRTVKVWIGIGLIAAVLGIGSTLAANITINGGKTAEFGQGAQHTVYCGAQGGQKISLTPLSSYSPTELQPAQSRRNHEDAKPNNAAPVVQANQASTLTSTYDGAGSFFFGGVKVSNIPEACSGVDFVITVYDTNGNAIDLLKSEGMTNPTVFFVNGCGVLQAADCPDGISNGQGRVLSAERSNWRAPSPANANATSTSDSFTINLSPTIFTDRIPTEFVGDITIETQNDTFGLNEYESNNPTVKAMIHKI